MRSIYPLVFKSIIKENVWGGSRLAALGKDLPAGRPHGESWEVVDLPDDQSIVAEGPAAGRSLNDLVQRSREALLGPVALDGGRFPLLVKYIDAAQRLSVQVHPDEAAVARLGEGRPKNEAWYILDAEPGAKLYLGFKPGVTREVLARALAAGGEGVEELLNAVEVSAGELYPVFPGTVHAIGAGVLLAEVQQPSDTTYRVYDWGRLGLDGKPRELHVAQALECIDFERRVASEPWRLDAGHFVVRVALVEGEPGPINGHGPRVLVGLEGRLELRVEGHHVTVERGRTVLVPHALNGGMVHGRGKALLVSFPAG